jgi:hypothetical protein
MAGLWACSRHGPLPGRVVRGALCLYLGGRGRGLRLALGPGAVPFASRPGSRAGAGARARARAGGGRGRGEGPGLPLSAIGAPPRYCRFGRERSKPFFRIAPSATPARSAPRPLPNYSFPFGRNSLAEWARRLIRVPDVRATLSKPSRRAVWWRYHGNVSRIYFRADAGFANPEVYEYLAPRRA